VLDGAEGRQLERDAVRITESRRIRWHVMDRQAIADVPTSIGLVLFGILASNVRFL